MMHVATHSTAGPSPAMPSLPNNPQMSARAVAGSRFACLGDSAFYRGHVEVDNCGTALLFATISIHTHTHHPPHFQKLLGFLAIWHIFLGSERPRISYKWGLRRTKNSSGHDFDSHTHASSPTLPKTPRISATMKSNKPHLLRFDNQVELTTDMSYSYSHAATSSLPVLTI